MSISPINFNGMIQNTSEVSNARQHEDSRAHVQQAAVSVEISKKEEAQSRKVNTYDETRQQEYRYDREGNGKGYQGNSQKKMLKKKSSENKKNDGSVNIKPTSTFDIKI